MRNFLRIFFLSAFILSFLTPGSVLANEFIQIKGSDTEVNLVQKMAEEYMKKQKNVDIAVTGGGSGTGIASLLNRKTDLADSSREIGKKEIAMTKKKKIEIISAVIVMDGLSIITHEANPIESLTTDELGKIFRGEIINWKELGGPDIAISLYGRQSNSGTFVFFRKVVLRADYSQKMFRMNGNSQIVEGVKKDRGGIGYVGVGYVKDRKTGGPIKGIHLVKIAKDSHSAPGSPLDTEAVVSGRYPLVRPLYQYMTKDVKKAAKDFVKWELSEAGQKIAVDMGFYPVTEEYKKHNKENGF